jgi:hypothetical protein
MMLARDHPEDIAPSLLEESIETLVVSVPNVGGASPDRCLVDCTEHQPCAPETVDKTRLPQPPITSAGVPEEGVDWPPIYQYTIEENSPAFANAAPVANSPLLVEIGGDRITWRRAQMELTLNYCYFPAPLSAVTRHHLLAALLANLPADPPSDLPGKKGGEMSWAAQMNVTVPFDDNAQFLADIGPVVSAEEDRLRRTVTAFYQRKLLTPNQRDATRPRLAVIVFDDRYSGTTALPAPPIADSRTTWRVIATR